MTIRTTRTHLTGAALLTSLALVVSGCAGSAGGAVGGQSSSEGYEYGASQEEITEVLADLEPVTLTYQPPASSSESLLGASATQWKERIEEMSGGKITIELVWGQAIASYAEIDDALIDGRLDLGYTVPGYDPNQYSAYNEVSKATSGFPNSPIVGNAVTGAVMAQIGYESEAVQQEFTDQGLVPLNAFSGTSPFYTLCSSPLETMDDWKGTQLRAGSQPHHDTVSALGGVATFMEFTETYEAIQRGTLDCEMGRITSAVDTGLLEVAPNMGYTDADSNFLNMAVGALVAGTSFEQLPLAYQQIIFDSLDSNFAESLDATAIATHEAVVQAKENGGSVTQYDQESLDAIKQVNEEKRVEVDEAGMLGDDFTATMDDQISTWTSAVEDLGYTDDGTLEEIDDWYSDDTDWQPIAEQVFTEVFLEHRPS